MNDDDNDRIEGLDRLVRAQKPRRDLWPGIEARLAPRGHRARTGRRWQVAQFAVAASLVAGLAGLFSLQMARAPVPAAAVESVAFKDVGPLETHSRAIVKANLAIVRQAESQLRKAIDQNPDSQSLRELLASTETQGRALRALL